VHTWRSDGQQTMHRWNDRKYWAIWLQVRGDGR
jgi:hypothetical protein